MSKQRINKLEGSEFEEKQIEAIIKSLQDVQQSEESKKKDTESFQWFGNIEDSQLEENETKEIIELLKPNLSITNTEDNFLAFYMTQTVYIDKSLLIKDIVGNNHMIITAPQR